MSDALVTLKVELRERRAQLTLKFHEEHDRMTTRLSELRRHIDGLERRGRKRAAPSEDTDAQPMVDRDATRKLNRCPLPIAPPARRRGN